MEYPEHEKMKANKGASQCIGAFLDWLQNEKRYTICEYLDSEEIDERGYDDVEEGYLSIPKSIEEFLADYFDIDLKKIEKEKRAMLDELRGEAK